MRCISNDTENIKKEEILPFVNIFDVLFVKVVPIVVRYRNWLDGILLGRIGAMSVVLARKMFGQRIDGHGLKNQMHRVPLPDV